MSEIRFGVIGCGEIAVQTIAGISAAENASIGMLMDTRAETLRDLAEFYGAPTTTDVEAVYANPDLDAVYIATPHDLHVPIGIRAAEAGKHVYCEKPISTNLPDADRLIAACEANGVTLGIAFAAQVDAAMAAARDILRAGILGRILAVRLTALGDKPDHYWTGGYTQRVKTDWRTLKARSGGGILIMNLIHDLNTVRWVTGLEVSRVYAEYDTLATEVEVEDTLSATVRYEGGAIGTFVGGSAMRGGGHADLRGPRIYCEKGQIILAPEPLIYQTEPAEGGTPGAWQPLHYAGPKGDRQHMVEGFAAAVLNGTEPPVTGLDGRKALEIAVACYRSGELHQPVSLPLEA